MENYISIKKAKYIKNYKIALEFNDGKKNVIDFKSFIFKSKHSNIRKYKDKDIFKNFNLNYGDIEWNDYELTFSINDLYLNTIK